MINIIDQLNRFSGEFVRFGFLMLVQVTALIVLLWLVDLVVRKKVRAIFRYWLWMLLLAKLILPPTLCMPTGIGYWCSFDGKLAFLASPTVNEGAVELERPVEDFSVAVDDSLAVKTEVDSEILDDYPLPVINSVVNVDGQPVAVVDEAEVVQRQEEKGPETIIVEANAALSWQAFVFLAWLVGLMILAVIIIQRLLFVKAILAQCQPANPKLQERLEACREMVGLKHEVPLVISPTMMSPAACGLFNPVIIIPANIIIKVTGAKLDAILLHELVHIKRGDLWVNFAQTILQIVNFFNPLLWLANSHIRNLREKAVDETVLTKMGDKADSYSSTLIDIAEIAFSKPHLSLRMVGVVESKKALKDRIKHIIMRPVPKSSRLGIAGLAVIIAIAAVLLPMAQGNAKSEKTVEGYSVTLANGMKIKLLGVCEHPIEGKQWWGPDGQALADAPIDYDKGDRVYAYGDDRAYEFAVRYENIPVGAYSIFHAEPTNSRLGGNMHSSANKNGERTAIYEKTNMVSTTAKCATLFNKDRKSCDFKIGVADGLWLKGFESIKPKKTGTWGTRSTGQSSEIGGVVFGKPIEENGKTWIAITDTIDRQIYQVRIIALDANGNEFTGMNLDSSGVGDATQTTISIDRPLNGIETVQVQTRKYEWFIFEGVSLKKDRSGTSAVELGGVPENSIEAEDSDYANWTYTYPDKAYLKVVAIFDPHAQPIRYWDAEGNIVAGMDEWYIQGVLRSKNNFGVVMEYVPEQEGIVPASDGKYYKVSSISKDKPYIRYSRGWGEWQDVVKINKGEVVVKDENWYKLDKTQAFGKGLTATMDFSFDPAFGIRLVAVDENGKQYPMGGKAAHVGDFQKDGLSMYHEATQDIALEKVDHFIIQKQKMDWAEIGGFAVKPGGKVNHDFVAPKLSTADYLAEQSEDWKTVGVTKKKSTVSLGYHDKGEFTIDLPKRGDFNKTVSIETVHSIDLKKYEVRMVALKKNGNIVLGSASGGGGNTFVRMSYIFQYGPLECYDEFRFQVREKSGSNVLTGQDMDDITQMLQKFYKVIASDDKSAALGMMYYADENDRELAKGLLKEFSSINPDMPVYVMDIDSVVNGRTKVYSLIPLKEGKYSLGIVRVAKDLGVWKLNFEYKKIAETYKMAKILSAEEMGRHIILEQLQQWQNASPAELEKLCQEKLVEAKRNIEAIEFAKTKNVELVVDNTEHWQKQVRLLSGDPEEVREAMFEQFSHYIKSREVFDIKGVVKLWVNNCRDNDKEKADGLWYSPPSPSFNDTREFLQAFPDAPLAEIVSVHYTDANAIAVTKLVMSKRGKEVVLLYTLKKRAGKWLISDIDMEQIEGLQVENSRFLKKYPGAKVWVDDPDDRVRVIGSKPEETSRSFSKAIYDRTMYFMLPDVEFRPTLVDISQGRLYAFDGDMNDQKASEEWVKNIRRSNPGACIGFDDAKGGGLFADNGARMLLLDCAGSWIEMVKAYGNIDADRIREQGSRVVPLKGVFGDDGKFDSDKRYIAVLAPDGKVGFVKLIAMIKNESTGHVQLEVGLYNKDFEPSSPAVADVSAAKVEAKSVKVEPKTQKIYLPDINADGDNKFLSIVDGQILSVPKEYQSNSKQKLKELVKGHDYIMAYHYVRDTGTLVFGSNVAMFDLGELVENPEFVKLPKDLPYKTTFRVGQQRYEIEITEADEKGCCFEYRYIGDRNSKATSKENVKPTEAATGKLEFRVLVDSVYSSGEYICTTIKEGEYKKALESEGPASAALIGSDFVWVEAAIGDEISLKVKGQYQGKTYYLAANTPDKTMLANDSWSIVKAYVTMDAINKFAIGIDFNEAAGDKFYEFTSNNKGLAVAIIIDDKIYSAPMIQSGIRSRCIITGDFTRQEVESLVDVLRSGMKTPDVSKEVGFGPVDFEGFFPDSVEGGKALDEMMADRNKDLRDADEIIATVRNGLRNYKGRDVVLRWFGNMFIWGKQPQNLKAIEVMYHASGSEKLYGNAIYFGLSVTKNKTSEILQAMAAVAMKTDDYYNITGRINWGCRGQTKELIACLDPYLKSNDATIAKKARDVKDYFTDSDAFMAKRAQEHKTKIQQEYGPQLAGFKEKLIEGDSKTRKEIMKILQGKGVMSIVDESFMDAFAACAKDPDAGVRADAARLFGGHFVWSGKEQSLRAIEILTGLLGDGNREVRYAAVYYGLSTVRSPDEKLVEKMLLTVLDDREVNYYGRVIWGIGRNRQVCIDVLTGWLEQSAQDSKRAVKAYEIYEDITGQMLPEKYAKQFAGQKSDAHDGLVAMVVGKGNISKDELKTEFVDVIKTAGLLTKVSDFYIKQTPQGAYGLFICENLDDRNAIRAAINKGSKIQFLGYQSGKIGIGGSGWLSSRKNFQRSMQPDRVAIDN
ncbi:MAG: hypothetical protein JEZ07_04350 [Phycisphaerae bacterium]|nr:hypothetical protein [Phycisphaerae bacterium]